MVIKVFQKQWGEGCYNFDMGTLGYILLSTFLISLGALVGVATLAIAERVLEKALLFLVSLSAGALMGGAFLHLLPESIEEQELAPTIAFEVVLLSFVVFFLVEKILTWRHCHKGKCDVHTFGYMNLIGDCVHNFIDGLVIAAAFVNSVELGVVTALAVALHEIPQEIGDFGVLLYAGWRKQAALLANFLVALVVVVGGMVGYYFSFAVESVTVYLLPFAAGGFIYIASSDLMPEIRSQKTLLKSMTSFGVFILGVVMMYLIRMMGE